MQKGLTGVFVCLQLNLFGQFSDSVNHYISYAATGTINKTNDGNSYVFTNLLKFNINRKDFAFNNTNSYIYGQQRQRHTNNDFASALDFNLYKTFPHFYYWGLAGYDKSFSLKINNRVQTGLGAAYKLIDKKNGMLNLSDGILFEYGDLNANTNRKVYRIFRNSLRIRFRWVIRDMVTLDGNNFLQSSLSDKNDYNVRSVTSLSFKLVKWLNFTTAANYNRLNATGRETLLITFGLTTDKYF
ncbi:MAG: DUF481 domain-containing protein [Williamsia sp.]|nr:DUF481 domain-containing protein [Williamsia sp.]